MCTNGAPIATKYQQKFKYLFENNGKVKRAAADLAIDALKKKGVPDKSWQEIQLECRYPRSRLPGYRPTPIFAFDLPAVPYTDFVPVICDYLFNPSIVVVFVVVMVSLTAMILGYAFLDQMVFPRLRFD